MEFILLGSILFLRVVQSISSKSNSLLMPEQRAGITVYLSLRMGFSAIGALVLLLISGNILEDFKTMPTLGWIIATVTGIALTVNSVCGLLVLKRVAIVLNSLFSTAGLLVPTVAGIFIYSQTVKFGQWIGIGMLFVAAVLLSLSSGQTNGKVDAKAYLLLTLSMLSNGSVMLLQTLYKTYVPNGSVSLYSFLQFAIPSAILFLWFFSWKIKTKEKVEPFKKGLLTYTVLAALAVLGISQISTVASATIPIAVLFPISDGGGTVISAIVAACLFKEKLTVKSVFGVSMGILGIILIKLLGN